MNLPLSSSLLFSGFVFSFKALRLDRPLQYRGTQEVYDVPSETTQFVDDFVVPRGDRREGTREASFMYSLRFYCVPADQGDLNAVYY